MTHKHDPAEYAARKAAKSKASADHGKPNTKDRLDNVEKALGIVPAAAAAK